MKKLVSLAITLMLILAAFTTFSSPVSAEEAFDKWDGTTYDTSWYDPSNTTKTEYTLTKASQLAGLADICNATANKTPGHFSGCTIYIAANLDLGGYKWPVIGNDNNHSFGGRLVGRLGGADGKSVIIKNMNIDTNGTSQKNVGLVGTQAGGGIENITLLGATISCPNNTTGSFVGYSKFSQCTYKNLISDADIICGGAKWVGGIVAYSNYDENIFENCVFTGKITCDSEATIWVGGICGNTERITHFKNCYVGGQINAACVQVGGFVGFVTAGVTVTFTDCQFDGVVNCTNKPAGSFVGDVGFGAKETTLTFTNCFNSGVTINAYPYLQYQFSWIGTLSGADGGQAMVIGLQNCYSLASFPVAAKCDMNRLYKVTTYDGTVKEVNSTQLNDLASISMPKVVETGKCLGSNAESALLAFDFKNTWAIRDAKYPVLACAVDYASGEFGSADYTWLDGTKDTFNIETEEQLLGLARLSKIYDFSSVTLKIDSLLKDQITKELFGEELANKLKSGITAVETTAEETTKAPDPVTEAPKTEAPAPETETPTETSAQTEKPAEEKKSGCSSVITAEFIVILVADLGCAWIASKKQK